MGDMGKTMLNNVPDNGHPRNPKHPKQKPDTHRYELPCANCKALVTVTPRNWLKYKAAKRLPFCAVNGCRKYQKFLSVDPTVLETENDYYTSAG